MQETREPDGTFTEKRIRIDEDGLRRKVEQVERERVLHTERAPIFRTRREREAVRG